MPWCLLCPQGSCYWCSRLWLSVGLCWENLPFWTFNHGGNSHIKSELHFQVVWLSASRAVGSSVCHMLLCVGGWAGWCCIWCKGHGIFRMAFNFKSVSYVSPAGFCQQRPQSLFIPRLQPSRSSLYPSSYSTGTPYLFTYFLALFSVSTFKSFFCLFACFSPQSQLNPLVLILVDRNCLPCLFNIWKIQFHLSEIA